MSSFGNGPRRNPGDEQPIVGSLTRGASPYVIVGVFVVLAVLLFWFLNSRRTETESAITPATTQTAVAAAPPPLELPKPVPPPPPAPPPAPVAPVVNIPATPPPPDDTQQRLHAPPVVVDLQQSGRASVLPYAASAPGVSGASGASPAPAAPGATPGGAPAAGASSLAGALPQISMNGSTPGAIAGGAALAGVAAANGGGSPLLGGASGPAGAAGSNDQFASRAEALPDPSVATQLRNLGTIITQGATIPAVLETAIDSDLPGFTRAIVSRDVLSFDGKNVLIPRGSRLIGQYRNAQSLGQSRVFVIWTRVIRPDGVTVQIGSPGDDALGRGGLTGEVNSHFFTRFGGAILLSVLNAGISAGVAAIAGTPSTEISIGSPTAAAGAAASASVPSVGADIPPTITVKQGVTINIFVARDLDFSTVQPVK